MKLLEKLTDFLFGGRLRLRDIFRFCVLRGDTWRSKTSWVVDLQFFRGAGYAIWCCNRRFTINGVTLSFGRNVHWYGRHNLVVRKRAWVRLCRNGNQGLMPEWS